MFFKVEVLALQSLQGNGEIDVSGRLEYVAEQGAFYMRDIQVDALKVERLSQTYQGQVKALAQSLLAEVLSQQPIYKFKDNDIRHQMAKASLKSVTVANEKLSIELDVF